MVAPAAHYPPKRFGHCTRCGDRVWQTEAATQIGFRLSDGTQCDVTFCLPCAHTLPPSEWPEVWRVCVEAAGLGSPAATAYLSGLRILEVQGRRRDDPAQPGAVIVDTR